MWVLACPVVVPGPERPRRACRAGVSLSLLAAAATAAAVPPLRRQLIQLAQPLRPHFCPLLLSASVAAHVVMLRRAAAGIRAACTHGTDIHMHSTLAATHGTPAALRDEVRPRMVCGVAGCDAALRGEVPRHVVNEEALPKWRERFGGKSLI